MRDRELYQLCQARSLLPLSLAMKRGGPRRPRPELRLSCMIYIYIYI